MKRFKGVENEYWVLKDFFMVKNPYNIHYPMVGVEMKGSYMISSVNNNNLDLCIFDDGFSRVHGKYGIPPFRFFFFCSFYHLPFFSSH